MPNSDMPNETGCTAPRDCGSVELRKSETRTGLVRLNSDGTLDAGFNPVVSAAPSCVAVQSDGLILVSGGIANAVAKLSYTKLLISIPADPVNEATSTAAATSGNLFRYDAKTKQYVFNWGTKGLTAGTYELKIDLGDGVSRTVNVTLK